MSAKIFGTKDWAARTINCCTGCANNCRYCYAKGYGDPVQATHR